MQIAIIAKASRPYRASNFNYSKILIKENFSFFFCFSNLFFHVFRAPASSVQMPLHFVICL